MIQLNDLNNELHRKDLGDEPVFQENNFQLLRVFRLNYYNLSCISEYLKEKHLKQGSGTVKIITNYLNKRASIIMTQLKIADKNESPNWRHKWICIYIKSMLIVKCHLFLKYAYNLL